MPVQGRACLVHRVNGECNFVVYEVHRKCRHATMLALAGRRSPLRAADPGQAHQPGDALCQETLRPRLHLGKLRQKVQPLFQRQADREQIAREEDVQAGESGARIPGQTDREHGAGNQKHRVRQRLQVAHAPQRHESEAAQDHHAQHQHQEDAVEEVDHLRRLGRVGLGGNQDQCDEERRQAVFGRSPYLGRDLPTGCDIRKDHDRKQRDEVQHHQQVVAPLPRRLVHEHLAAHQTREHAHPEHQQPRTEPENDRGRAQADQRDLSRGNLVLPAQKRLPDQQQAQMRQQQRPRPHVGYAAQRDNVQQHEHRNHDEPPIALRNAEREQGETIRGRSGLSLGLHPSRAASSLAAMGKPGDAVAGSILHWVQVRCPPL